MPPTSINPPGSRRVGEIVPLVVLLILLAATFANFAHYSFALFRHPFEWDSFEGYHVYQSWRFARGEPLYKEIHSYPLLVSNYPPVFFVLGGGLLGIFGLGFWPLRLLALAAALASGATIYLIVKGENRSGFWALASALLFFASPVFASYFLPMVRIDGLALAFSLAGLYFIRRGIGSNRALAISGVFFLLAVYTKQTAVLAAIAGWLWLLANKPLKALVMGAASAVAGLAVFILIERSSGGEFYRQLFVLNVGRYSFGQAQRMFVNFLSRWGVFFAAAAIATVAGTGERGPWRCFFVISLFNGFFAARHGAVAAYYLPVVAATAIVCGIAAGRFDLPSAGAALRKRRWGITAAATVGLISANGWQYIRPVRADAVKMEEARGIFSRAAGDILTFQMHSLAFLNGREVFVFPTSLESTTGFRDLEYSPLYGDIERGRFQVVLDSRRHSLVSPEIRERLRKRYEPAGVIVLPVHRPGGDEFVVWRLREAAEGAGH